MKTKDEKKLSMNNLTIGISTGIKNAQMSPGEIPCAVLSVEFIKLCNKFNAQAVIFPPQFNQPNFSLKGIDGLIITGGGDIDPSNYGEDPIEKLERVSIERDLTELNLLKRAEEENIKTLAICRGHQLLNIYKGGSLHQDINDAGFNDIEHANPYENAIKHIHEVSIKNNTKLEGVLKSNKLKVNSIHHQAIKNIGKDLIVSAKSSDGIIEGIETTSEWDAIGVQWHPEYISKDKSSIDLFNWLIN